MSRIDDVPAYIRSAAASALGHAAGLVGQWLPGGHRHGHEYVCSGLGGGPGRSLSVNLTTGKWADFASDEAGGDLVSLLAAVRGCSQLDAAKIILGWTPDTSQARAPAPPPAPPAPPPKSEWRAIGPVPETAHKPNTFAHYYYGDPQQVWTYRRGSELWGYIRRFATSDGGKEVVPYTWCVSEKSGGMLKWHQKQWDAPRPLYLPGGEPDSNDKPILIVEGEKCADAAHALLGDTWYVVSWPGGGKAWDKAAWSWLDLEGGRSVTLWPDADSKRVKPPRGSDTPPESMPLLPGDRQPGWATMTALAEHLTPLGAACRIVPLAAPGTLPDGWDIADAINDGAGTDELLAHLATATLWPADAPATAGSDGPPGDDPPPEDPGSTPSGGWREGGGWRDLLQKTDKGAIKPTRENVEAALNHYPPLQGLLAWDAFAYSVTKTRAAPWDDAGETARDWSEVEEFKLGRWLVRALHFPSISAQTLGEAVRLAAADITHHPVRDYLQGLVWDGAYRLDGWLERVTREPLTGGGFPDDALHRYLSAVGRMFLGGMVERALRPGCKFDYMLILQGQQGLGKSTLLKTLGGDWFGDSALPIGDKDGYQNIASKWLWEIAELDSFNKHEESKVKQFLSSQVDTFRGSYDRRPSSHPRQVVFAGTTNEDQYLKDITGARRFWPVTVTRQIDVMWLRENRDQLFAEAMAYIAAGGRTWPDAEESSILFEPQQKEREPENELKQMVWLALYSQTDERPGNMGRFIGRGDDVRGPRPFLLAELLLHMGLDAGKQSPGRHHAKQIRAALMAFGFDEKRGPASLGANRPREWHWPAEAPDQPGAVSVAAGASPGVWGGLLPADPSIHPNPPQEPISGVPF